MRRFPMSLRSIVLLTAVLGITSPSAAFVPGDVNSDGALDVLDATVLRREIAGLGPGITQMCVDPCGDAMIDAGEECDGIELGGSTCVDLGFDGGTLGCTAECMYDTTACTQSTVISAVVTNDNDPTQPGPGVPSVWSYGGNLGITAGNAMCAAAGSDHVCTYAELLTAQSQGEFSALTEGLDFWVHRVSVNVLVGGILSPPGPGGRCNDWTDAGNQISDGEFGVVVSGSPDYRFDQDTTFTGDPADGHQGSGPNDGGLCGGVARAILCCAQP